jgi:hypothetical protein
VIIPVKRRKIAAVRAAAAKLARRHNIACYDPEAEKVFNGKG